MIQKIKHQYKQEQFKPTFLGLFINPSYIIRIGILNSIKKHSKRFHGKMLDFGCGSKPYRSEFNVTEYIGIDIKESGHDNRNESIDIYYDGKKIPVKNNTFDCVLASEVFEHVFNPSDLLKELHRVTKKNGILLFTIPFMWEEHEVPYDYARYTKFGFSHLLKANKFEIIEINKVGNSVLGITQLWISYLSRIFLTKNGYYNFIIRILILAPWTILGLIANILLPNKKDLYLNTVFLVRKK
jgi:SAM-dependent methyltransferase